MADARDDDAERELSPLAERLRTMHWPTPTDEVRERCLREIMSRVGEEDDGRGGQRDESETGTNRAAG
jgi:hypothetical protein